MSARSAAPKKKLAHGQPPKMNPPGPVRTSGGSSQLRPGESPTSSSVGRLATPSRGESSSALGPGSGAAPTPPRSGASPPSKEQLERQRQLEQLLSLPSNYERIGGGYAQVPRPVEEVLNAAVQAVTREHGDACLDERGELADALGFAIAENDELRSAFGDESVLDEMRLRVEQAQREAARHESNLATFRDEADDAQRAAAEAQRLQTDLLQVQRQLASWVVDAVERSRAQRIRVEEAKQRGASAVGAVVSTLGSQLHATHAALDGVAHSAASLEVRNEELLDSLAFFATSRSTLRDTLRGIRAWQRYAHNASLRRDAAVYWRTSSVLAGFNAWIDSNARERLRQIGERRRQLELVQLEGELLPLEASPPAAPAASSAQTTDSGTPATPMGASPSARQGTADRPVIRSGSTVAMLASRYEAGFAPHEGVDASDGFSGTDDPRAPHQAADEESFEMPAWLRATAAAVTRIADSLPASAESSDVEGSHEMFTPRPEASQQPREREDPRALEPPMPPARRWRAVPHRYDDAPRFDDRVARMPTADVLRQNLLPSFDNEARPTGATSPVTEDASPPDVAMMMAAVRESRLAVTAAALAEAEADAASALANAEAEHAAAESEVSPEGLADAERVADQIAAEARSRSSRKAALTRATAKAKAAAAVDAAKKMKELAESDEVLAAAGHLGPVAWEAGVIVDAALSAVASCAASFSSLEKVEAEQEAYTHQEAVETSQKTAEAAMAAVSAISVMESFFEAKQAGLPEEPSIHEVAMDSVAAIEVAEKAFEMIRAQEGPSASDDVHCNECAADAEAAVAGFAARFEYNMEPQEIPKESGSEAAEGALAAVAACVMELVDPDEAHEAAMAGASAVGAVAKVSGQSDAALFSEEEQEFAAMRATAARLCAVAERVVEENAGRHAALTKAVELATRCEVMAELDLAEAAVAVEEATAVPYTHPSSRTAVEINEAHEAAKKVILAEREAEAEARLERDAHLLHDHSEDLRQLGEEVVKFRLVEAIKMETEEAEANVAARAAQEVDMAMKLAHNALAADQHHESIEVAEAEDLVRSADDSASAIAQRVARARASNSLLRTDINAGPPGRGMSCKASVAANEVHAELHGVEPSIRMASPGSTKSSRGAAVVERSDETSSVAGHADEDEDESSAFLAAVSARARAAVNAAMQGQAVLAATARAEAAKEEAHAAAQDARDLQAQTKARAAAAASMAVVHRAEAVAEVAKVARPAMVALDGIADVITATREADVRRDAGGTPHDAEAFEAELKAASARAHALLEAAASSTPGTQPAGSGRTRSRLESAGVGFSAESMLVMDDTVPAGNLDIMDSVNPLLEATSPRSGGVPLSPRRSKPHLTRNVLGAAGGRWSGGQLFGVAILLLSGLLVLQAAGVVNAGLGSSLFAPSTRGGRPGALPLGVRFIGNRPSAGTGVSSPSWTSRLWGSALPEEEDPCLAPTDKKTKIECKRQRQMQRNFASGPSKTVNRAPEASSGPTRRKSGELGNIAQAYAAKRDQLRSSRV